MTAPPTITHVLELCLYVKDIHESVNFYKDVLDLPPDLDTPRMATFPIGNTVLILFQLGKTGSDMYSENGIIPHHGPTQAILDQLLSSSGRGDQGEVLKQHFCLGAKDREDVEEWEKRFKDKGVTILSTMNWEKGGRSVYFRDPDGHIGEIASRGIWPNY